MPRRSITKEVETVKRSLNGRSIVLVGLMGAGKSTIGRRLAQKLGLAFVDADAEIERAAGKSVPDIFRDHGEDYFREGERRVIARLLESGSQVLATGGGAYMNKGTRENIERMGIAVWLKADISLLMKRVRRRDNRPLLKSEDPEEVMRQLMAERYPVYGLADITVESRDVPHNSIVSDVIRALAAHGRGRRPATDGKR
ncbi:MAG TPA: shikimate kinase [Aestuariivirgaceae bacterium]|jgi:shikimate kinase